MARAYVRVGIIGVDQVDRSTYRVAVVHERGAAVDRAGVSLNSLFDLEFDASAIIHESATRLIRRVRHDSFACVVDNGDEIGVIVNLSGSHRIEGHIASVWSETVPDIGTISIIPPYSRVQFSLRGRCRVLNLRLPESEMSTAARRHLDGGLRQRLRPRVHIRDDRLLKLVTYATCQKPDEQRFAIGKIADYIWFGAHDSRQHQRSRQRGGMAPVILRKVLSTIDERLHTAMPLADLARTAQLSTFHFCRAFATATGVSPHQFILRQRIARAIDLLDTTGLPVEEISRRTGFVHSSHLARAMRQRIGATPEQFRRFILP